MPTRINGIGTWYWGKNNILTRNANCEFCGTYRQLTSYDTTLYFTFLFVPLLPLQRKRVIDQCPGCRRHRSIALAKWEQNKADSLMTALQDWQGDRGNAEKARKALGVTIAYHDRQAFEDLSPTVAQAFARDASMQTYLAEANEHFGDRESAEACFRTAAQSNDPAARRALAAYLIRQLRPDEAQPLLQDILPTKDRAGSKLLLALAQAYQAKGDHESAGKLVDEIGTAFPDLLSNAEYDRIRRTSQKYRGTNKAITAPGFDPAKRGGAMQASWFQRNGAKAVVGLILAVVIIGYLGIAFSEGSHKVFIVNGTNVPYTALINGKPYNLRAHDNFPIVLDEGTCTVSVQDHPEIEPATVAMHTNFWKRPFDRRTFVINPDRTALMYERKIEYSAHPTDKPSGDDEFQLFVGDVGYNVKKPDDAFTQPPSTVDLSSDTSTVTRRELELYEKMTVEQMAGIVQLHLGPDAAREWMKRRAATSNDDSDTLRLLGLISMRSKPEETIAFLRPHLSDRPVRINWHRHYQQMMEKQHPEYDLRAEYDKLLSQNPTDATLIYLAARTIEDRKERRAGLEKALAAAPPCSYASYSLAYDDMCDMNFQQALVDIRPARQREPDNPQFIWAESESLEAVGNYAGAADLARSQQKHDGHDHGYVDEEVRLRVAKGDPAGAQQRIELYCKELDSLQVHKEFVDQVRSSLDATYAYARGDMPAYTAAMKQLKSSEYDFERTLAQGDYDAAETALKKSPITDQQGYLLLSAIAGAGGNKAIADRAFAEAKSLLAAGDRQERKLAAVLADSSAPPSEAQVRECGGRPEERCYLLVCLAQRFPQLRPWAIDTATKLNYCTRFPHREVTAAIAKLK